MAKLRIAQVSPLWERVPPPSYGGIELVVSYLTDELVRRGHDVTLFASGDSQTLAKLESVYPCALRLDPNIREYSVYEIIDNRKLFGYYNQHPYISISKAQQEFDPQLNYIDSCCCTAGSPQLSGVCRKSL